MGKTQNSEDVIKVLRRDMEKAKAKGDYAEVARCWNFIGAAAVEQGKFEEALNAHQEELKVCNQIKDRLGSAVAHRMIGETLSMTGAFKKAAEQFKEYMRVAKELNNEIEIQRAEISFGRLYWLHFNTDTKKNLSSLDKAENYYRTALVRAAKLKTELQSREYFQMKSRTLLNLALVYEEKGNSASTKLLEDAISIAKKHGFTDDLLRCEISLSGMLIKKGLFLDARKVTDEAIQVAKQLKDNTQLCEALLMKAGIMVNLLDYDGARHVFKQAYHTESYDEDHKIKAKNGCVRMKQVIETLKEINLTSDLETHYKLYDKLGDYFVDINCYTVALDYYKRELSTALKLGKSREELADIYYSLAQTYKDNKQFTEAEEALKKESEHRDGNSKQPEPSEDEGDEEDTKEVQEIVGSDVEVSDLTDDSDPEESAEDNKKGKALRSRRPTRRIVNSLKKNEKGESALHRACIEGNLSLVIKLVEGGHEVNVRDHAGWLPIHEASNHGYAEIVDYLIKKKSLINDKGGSECGDTTPLHDACANGNIDVIRVLIRNGANVIARDVRGNSPLDLLQKRIGDGDTLTKDQKLDVDLLYKEMKSLMKKAGYDFKAQNPTLVKRKHNPDLVVKPVDNYRTRRDRSPSQSPPRKSLKAHKQREAVDAKNAYKEVISHLRRPHDLVTGPPPARSKSKFKGLIDEDECVVDEWMINDLKPSALKDKRVLDAYEMTSKLEKMQTTERRPTKKVRKPISMRNTLDLSDDDEFQEESHHQDSDRDDPEETSEQNDMGPEYSFVENDDREDENSDSNEVSIYNSPPRGYFSSILTTQPPLSRSPSPLPPTNVQSSTSTSSSNTNHPTSQGSTTSSPASQEPTPAVVNEKFLVTVHLEGKKFLLAVPNRLTQVAWLAEKTADRYYQMRQLRPQLCLTTEEGAMLGLDDLIVDVCLNNQVYANIDSWDLEPLSDRYESTCKLKKGALNHDLKFRLKLSETSGKLSLTNLLLEGKTINHFLSSLRCQKNLRCLDFSFSNILLLDSEDLLPTILSTLPDLEEINLKGTGLVSVRVYSLSRSPLNKVTDIDLKYNSLDDHSTNQLIQLISNCPSLKRIDLSFNDFSSQFKQSSNLIELCSTRNISISL